MIRNSKRDYYIAIIEQCVSDSSKFWQCLMELDPKSTAPPPPKLKEAEEDITDTLEIATHFNTLFSHITENYLSDDNRPTPSCDKHKVLLIPKYPQMQCLTSPPIEHDFVLKELQNLDPKKAVGTDGLSSKILWMIAPAIVTAIVKVINLSIGSSQFPTPWKMARVCTIFKNGRSITNQ